MSNVINQIDDAAAVAAKLGALYSSMDRTVSNTPFATEEIQKNDIRIKDLPIRAEIDRVWVTGKIVKVFAAAKQSSDGRWYASCLLQFRFGEAPRESTMTGVAMIFAPNAAQIVSGTMAEGPAIIFANKEQYLHLAGQPPVAGAPDLRKLQIKTALRANVLGDILECI